PRRESYKNTGDRYSQRHFPHQQVTPLHAFKPLQ
ncbi:MAG: hypothetical protein ACI8SJ_000638, partial [Shewanella sp.]